VRLAGLARLTRVCGEQASNSILHTALRCCCCCCCCCCFCCCVMHAGWAQGHHLEPCHPPALRSWRLGAPGAAARRCVLLAHQPWLV